MWQLSVVVVRVLVLPLDFCMGGQIRQVEIWWDQKIQCTPLVRHLLNSCTPSSSVLLFSTQQLHNGTQLLTDLPLDLLSLLVDMGEGLCQVDVSIPPLPWVWNLWVPIGSSYTFRSMLLLSWLLVFVQQPFCTLCGKRPSKNLSRTTGL